MAKKLDLTPAVGFGTTGTVNAAGLAENDIVFLMTSVGGQYNQTVTWPSGFNEIANLSYQNPPAIDWRTEKIAWARMGTTPPSSFAVSWGAADAFAIHGVVFDGRSTTVAPEAFPTVPTGFTNVPNGASLSLPMVGGAMQAGDDILWYAEVGGSASVGVYTAPSGFSAVVASGQSYATSAYATRNNVSAGTLDPITGSWLNDAAGADQSFAGAVIRIPTAVTSVTGSGATTEASGDSATGSGTVPGFGTGASSEASGDSASSSGNVASPTLTDVSQLTSKSDLAGTELLAISDSNVAKSITVDAAISRFYVGSGTVAALNALAAPKKILMRLAYATNGRRSGETAGNGTGCPVWSDGTNWRTFYDNSIVSA